MLRLKLADDSIGDNTFKQLEWSELELLYSELSYSQKLILEESYITYDLLDKAKIKCLNPLFLNYITTINGAKPLQTFPKSELKVNLNKQTLIELIFSNEARDLEGLKKFCARLKPILGSIHISIFRNLCQFYGLGEIEIDRLIRLQERRVVYTEDSSLEEDPNQTQRTARDPAMVNIKELETALSFMISDESDVENSIPRAGTTSDVNTRKFTNTLAIFKDSLVSQVQSGMMILSGDEYHFDKVMISRRNKVGSLDDGVAGSHAVQKSIGGSENGLEGRTSQEEKQVSLRGTLEEPEDSQDQHFGLGDRSGSKSNKKASKEAQEEVLMKLEQDGYYYKLFLKADNNFKNEFPRKYWRVQRAQNLINQDAQAPQNSQNQSQEQHKDQEEIIWSDPEYEEGCVVVGDFGMRAIYWVPRDPSATLQKLKNGSFQNLSIILEKGFELRMGVDSKIYLIDDQKNVYSDENENFTFSGYFGQIDDEDLFIDSSGFLTGIQFLIQASDTASENEKFEKKFSQILTKLESLTTNDLEQIQTTLLSNIGLRDSDTIQEFRENAAHFLASNIDSQYSRGDSVIDLCQKISVRIERNRQEVIFKVARFIPGIFYFMQELRCIDPSRVQNYSILDTINDLYLISTLVNLESPGNEISIQDGKEVKRGSERLLNAEKCIEKLQNIKNDLLRDEVSEVIFAIIVDKGYLVEYGYSSYMFKMAGYNRLSLFFQEVMEKNESRLVLDMGGPLKLLDYCYRKKGIHHPTQRIQNSQNTSNQENTKAGAKDSVHDGLVSDSISNWLQALDNEGKYQMITYCMMSNQFVDTQTGRYIPEFKSMTYFDLLRYLDHQHRSLVVCLPSEIRDKEVEVMKGLGSETVSILHNELCCALEGLDYDLVLKLTKEREAGVYELSRTADEEDTIKKSTKRDPITIIEEPSNNESERSTLMFYNSKLPLESGQMGQFIVGGTQSAKNGVITDLNVLQGKNFARGFRTTNIVTWEQKEAVEAQGTQGMAMESPQMAKMKKPPLPKDSSVKREKSVEEVEDSHQRLQVVPNNTAINSSRYFEKGGSDPVVKRLRLGESQEEPREVPEEVISGLANFKSPQNPRLGEGLDRVDGVSPGAFGDEDESYLVNIAIEETPESQKLVESRGSFVKLNLKMSDLWTMFAMIGVDLGGQESIARAILNILGFGGEFMGLNDNGSKTFLEVGQVAARSLVEVWRQEAHKNNEKNMGIFS